MQLTVIFGYCAVLFYLTGSVFQGISLTSNRDTHNKVLSFGLLAVLAHGVSA
ncbi:MAG: hypothetical protein HQ498_04735, partial [Pseudohongiella sp.]|nr:hypothetical protein [Pseudohongiella sp.]